METRPGTCDNCGDAEDLLFPVHRSYVTPESWDAPANVVTLHEVERWCVSCCTIYPHEPAGGEGPASGRQ